MSVHSDPNGRRSVSIEVEVPGTPDQVWKAIATSEGVSSWFQPTEFEMQDGKVAVQASTFGPDMVARSKVTAWDAPRMFSTEMQGWIPGSPPLATEWHVEAKSGDACIIRVVYSLFADNADWDDQLLGASGAFGGFLRTLRLYCTHFLGQSSAVMQIAIPAAMSEADAWTRLTQLLGVHGRKVGEAFTAPADAPAFGGVLEYYTEEPLDALIRVNVPGAAIGALGVYTYPGQDHTMVAVNFYHYGSDAAERAAREQGIWEAYMSARFPAPPQAA
jgi:uncharacterized protein YndB with AHSA1/START domain